MSDAAIPKGFDERSIAMVGMSGRFPGAGDVEAFWNNLEDATESITRFSAAELESTGVSPESLREADYVKARGVLHAAEDFDAAFFGLAPREAQVLDPQHRVFLECAHDALEHAGYDPERTGSVIGVYAGCGMNTYLVHHLVHHPELIDAVGEYQVMLGNDKDFVATRASYLLDLKGPSVNVQTACSTSLVAVHLACQSLVDYDCDLALAGGVSISLPQRRGYRYRKSGILSPDGRCRAFAVDAGGTVQGNGAGVVVLKRLAEALAEGDTVYAVIRGSAINNDGGGKVGFTAPSVEGQSEVIAAAQAVADVDPATITFVEAHGTGTELGDLIEVKALTRTFSGAQRSGPTCALGSVKSNVGHLDTAAGAAGLIKAALALHHRRIPPTLHSATPSPRLGLEESPFYVAAKLEDWASPPRTPRRAGVSSFGIGGTNAHVVLEEAPEPADNAVSRPAQLLVLSARTPAALDEARRRLAEHLGRKHLGRREQQDLADVAFTLQTGRRLFEHRCALVCEERAEATAALSNAAPERLRSAAAGEAGAASLVFLFPGQGAQVIGMGCGLYRAEPVFRDVVDECADLLAPHLDLDLRTLLFPESAAEHDAQARLAQTAFTQPALFVIEYALARLWREWGVVPDAMIGHSIGEYVAACLAGVFSLEDGLALVATRGRLMQSLPPGAMLSVEMDEEALRERLAAVPGLSIAAVNGPKQCVASGPIAAIEALAADLAVRHKRLDTSHAFHSPMTEPILETFRGAVGKVELREPEGRFLSNLTGDWADAAVARPDYWVGHLRRTVRFADALATLFADGPRRMLEVGPGRSLSNLSRHLAAPDTHISACLPRPLGGERDVASMLTVLADLWLDGRTIDWTGFYRHERRRRVALPTYPFQRQRYFVDAPARREHPGATTETPTEVLQSQETPTEARRSPALLSAALPPSLLAPRPALRSTYLAPRDGRERQLALLWQDSLGVDGIGVHDDFFEFGGHSLLATQLLSRVRRETGVEIALREFFDRPTIADLARHLETFTGAAPSASPEVFVPRPRDGPVPLSFGQERLWFLDQLEPGDPAFHLPFAVRFAGALDVGALDAAVRGVVRRHEALRTTFPAADRQPRQEIAPEAPSSPVPSLPVVDLSALPEGRQQSRAARLLDIFSQLPFDLGSGPLVRLLLVRAAPDDHTALLVLHHIVADGWSIGVLVRDLAVLYRAAAESAVTVLTEHRLSEHRLPELTHSYADFALWQRRRFTPEVLEPLLEAWRGELEGAPPGIELASDRPRPGRPSLRGGVLRHPLGADVYRRVEELAVGTGTTAFMVLLAVFATWLRRTTGQRDLLVGSPVAGRDRPEIEGLIGLFINTLVLRTKMTDLDPDPTFETLLGRVREAALNAFALRDAPFDKVVDAVAPRREVSRTPLAQVMFVLQNAPVETLELPGLTWTPVDVGRVSTHFDLSVQFSERGGGLPLRGTRGGARGGTRGGMTDLVGEWLFSRDLFDATTVERAARHFACLVDASTRHPRRRLSELPLLSAAQRHAILREWNDCQPSYAGDPEPIHRLFERQAERRGETTAVEFEGEKLSYRDLNARANRLAWYLRRRGVGPEVLVGISMERSFDLEAALLAILKAGGAYVPLDPALPGERIRFMLEDSRASVLLSDDGASEEVPVTAGPSFPPRGRTSVFPPPIPPAGVLVLHLAAERAAVLSESARNPPPVVHPDHPAYVIYTSGSTGRPKGTVISHRALTNRLCYACEHDLEPGEAVLQKTTISFDVAVFEAFAPLLVGGRVIVSRPGGQLDMAYLAGLIADHQVAKASFPPSVLAKLLEEPAFCSAPGLKRVLAGGETVPPELAADFHARLGVDLQNRYGPTEATISVTQWTCRRGEVERNLPIGRPIARARIYLFDRTLCPVPARVPGELAIGGPSLARGYLARPGLTAAAFVPDPLTGIPGERLYRTGDLALYRPDGVLEFRGRIDHQVKIRGFRVELGEIETTLGRHPAVRETVVTVFGDEGARYLAAYYVARSGSAPGAAQLRGHLQERLPDYMVPAAFVELEALPLSATGKVDPGALPAPDRGGGTRYEAPRDGVEATLAGIWAELLKCEQVGIDDNFFELGGDSILTTQVVARAGHAGIRLTPRQLFENQTIAELARVAGTTPQPGGEQGLVTGPVPLTPIQRWFLERDVAEPHHFNQAVLLELRRPAELAVLAGALAFLPRHHDALRLRFAWENGQWRQRHGDVAGAASLAVIDLRSLTPERQAGAFERAAGRLEASLDLDSGPTVRGALFRQARGERLLLAIHHLAVDGLSWRILLEDLERFCGRLERGEPVAMPAKTTSFKAWAEHLAEQAESGAVESEAALWRRHDEDTPPLPVDRPGGNTAPSGSAKILSKTLDESATRQLVQEAGKTYNNKVDEILVAALAEALLDWLRGPRHLRLHLESHGREAADETLDLSRTVGWFTALFPWRLDLEGTFGPGEVLKSVKEQLRAVPRLGVGYGLLPPRPGGPAPAPEVSFNYLGHFGGDAEEGALFLLSGEEAGALVSPRARRTHLVDVNAAIFEGRLEVRFTYSEDVHRRSTIERLADGFVDRLDSLVSHCLEPEAGGYTPSDFTDVDLDQDQLDRILEKLS